MTVPGRQLAIDFNADIGESATPDQQACDDELMEHVTSVNIACGGHAGDEASMRRAVRAAAGRGVAIGAHPSYPDRVNFGRVRMPLDEGELRILIVEQLASLDAVVRSEGAELVHCKPHGALYHAASEDESVARAIYDACAGFGAGMRLIGQSGSRAVARWRAWGARVAAEAFADRVYEPDGSLRARTRGDALITDAEMAAAQAVRIAVTPLFPGTEGSAAVRADTLCVHSDTPNAEMIARRVAELLRSEGVILRSLRKIR